MYLVFLLKVLELGSLQTDFHSVDQIPKCGIVKVSGILIGSSFLKGVARHSS